MTGMDKVIVDNKWIKKKYWKYLVGGGVIVSFLLFFILKKWVNSIVVDKDRLNIATVFKGVFNDYIIVNGITAPTSTILLDAYEGGKVEEIYKEEGSMVKKGDIIVRFSNTDLNINILNSESQLAEKANFLREALISMEQEKHAIEKEILNGQFDVIAKKRTFEQNAELYKDELISKNEYLKSEEEYRLAEKTLKLTLLRQRQDSAFRNRQVEQITDNLSNMQVNLGLIKLQQEYLYIKSPVDGQLGKLLVELGQSVPRGFRVGQINVLNSYKIEADVDEHYIDRIRTGLTGYIEGGDDSLLVQIQKVYPEVQNRNFKIDLMFSGKLPERIRIGQSYMIKLQMGQPTEALQISQGSFFQTTGGQWIFVLDKSGKYAIKRNIEIGRKNPLYYEIISGLHQGEKVIVSDYSIFGNCDRVEFK